MITIKQVCNNFKVTFSNPGSGERGFSVTAKSLEEVHEAINHYHQHGPRVTQHVNNQIEHCPLCRKEREEQEKKPRTRPLLRLADV